MSSDSAKADQRKAKAAADAAATEASTARLEVRLNRLQNCHIVLTEILEEEAKGDGEDDGGLDEKISDLMFEAASRLATAVRLYRRKRAAFNAVQRMLKMGQEYYDQQNPGPGRDVPIRQREDSPAESPPSPGPLAGLDSAAAGPWLR